MPPLPTLWDPAGAVDKLPQPFRMIDKILAGIVEQVVDLIGKREHQRRLEEAARVNLVSKGILGGGVWLHGAPCILSAPGL